LLGRLIGQQMAAARRPAQYFAGSGYLEALGYGFLGFLHGKFGKTKT
jgi:hypothetical protein